MRNQNGRTIAGMLNVIFMELPKIEPVPDDISLLTPVQMWGKFFLYANKPDKSDFVEKLAEQNRGIKMAVTVLKNISQDEINWYHETRYWMHVSDQKSMISSAEDRGIAKGELNKAIATAKNLLRMKLGSNQQISEATGLPVNQIEELAKKN